MITLSAASIDWAESLIVEFEGRRLAPYLDLEKRWTIGDGNRFLLDGSPVGPDTRPLTEGEADMLRTRTLRERVVPGFCRAVCVPLQDNQAAALLSFVWNVGNTRFAQSSVARDVNGRELDQVPHDLRQFVYARGHYIRGLFLRRVHEAEIFQGQPRPATLVPTHADLADEMNARELQSL